MSRRTDTVRIYEDTEGLIRWQWRSSNGNILADSGQGYVNGDACVRIASRLGAALGIPVLDLRPGAEPAPKGGWWRRSRP